MFGGGSLEDQTKDDLGSIAIEIHCVEECRTFEQICMAGFEVFKHSENLQPCAFNPNKLESLEIGSSRTAELLCEEACKSSA